MSITAKRLVLVIAPIVCGVIAVALGKDVNWDLRNYHYYNAYALLNGRLGVDGAPAQLQTFYNPLLDLPFFFMTRHLPAAWIGFILGCVQGLCLSFLFLIWSRVARFARAQVQVGIGIALLAVSAGAPGFLYQLGGTMNDNLISLFVVVPVLLVLVASDRNAANRGAGGALMAVAGFILGAGVGLKPSAAIYAVSSALALVFLFATWRERLRFFALYSAAGVAGGAVSAGWWCGELWARYGNPVLPYFNNVFQSPFVRASVFSDRRFNPREMGEYLVWPLVFSGDSLRVAEVEFVDVRFAVMYLALALWALSAWRRKEPVAGHFDRRKASFLLAFFVLSFVVWLALFPYYRYLITLELFVPLAFLALLERLVPTDRWRAAAALLVLVAMYAVFKPLDYGRAPWSDPYIAIEGGQRALPEGAVVVMLGSAPLSYVIPHFPPTTRFLRPEGNLRPRSGELLFEGMREALSQVREPRKLYVLFNERDRGVDFERSSRDLGLDLRPRECSPLKTNLPDHLSLCAVAGW